MPYPADRIMPRSADLLGDPISLYIIQKDLRTIMSCLLESKHVCAIQRNSGSVISTHRNIAVTTLYQDKPRMSFPTCTCAEVRSAVSN